MKKNNKGFTLIELLAAITIMAIVMLAVIPSINRLQNNNKEKPYEFYGESLVEAAKVYVNKEGEDITSLGIDNWRGCVDITYNELLSDGLIKVFDDNKYDCTNGKVRYTKAAKQDQYSYNLTCKEKRTGKIVYSHQTFNGSCSQNMACPSASSEKVGLPLNDAKITSYQDACADKSAMFSFEHTAGAQQSGYSKSELTDYRYIGNTPNNYIQFNDELWRIIGVFTVQNSSGSKEQRIKIIRNSALVPYLIWDNRTEGETTGVNHWNDAPLNLLLNEKNVSINGSYYWDKAKGECYGSNTYEDSNIIGTMECDFATIGLSEKAKSYIEPAKWYLGGIESAKVLDAPNLYKLERDNALFSSKTYPRSASWTGAVGLVSLSDYAYSFAYDVDPICYNKNYHCKESEGNPAASWLTMEKEQATMTTSSTIGSDVFTIDEVGSSNASVAKFYEIRPVVYLKKGTTIASGRGTFSNPYLLK